MRAALLALLLLPACFFDPRGVPAQGGDDDGGPPPDARPGADAGPDAATPPDAPPPDAAQGTCPNGYSVEGYRLVNSMRSWDEAVADCADDGAPFTHLVMIQDDAENGFVDSFSSNRDVWIGVTDGANEGQWRDLDGMPLQFEPWDFLEPNNGGITGPDENCGQLRDGGAWNDLPCSDTLRFVCECDAAQ